MSLLPLLGGRSRHSLQEKYEKEGGGRLDWREEASATEEENINMRRLRKEACYEEVGERREAGPILLQPGQEGGGFSEGGC